MKRLSAYVSKDEGMERVEDELPYNIKDDELLVDEGFYLDFYCSHEGVFKEENPDGCSYLIFVNVDTKFSLLLDLIGEGSFKDETLTLRVVGKEETDTRKICEKNAVTKLFLESIIKGQDLGDLS